MNFKDYWDKVHKKFSLGTITYDNWLDNYKEIIDKCKTKILDLGCGSGNNSLYLSKKGHNVIACDVSNITFENIKEQAKNVETIQLDISKHLPFDNHSFDLIIADLSLHYFNKEATIEIIKEIKRILKPNGHLLARVNSINDSDYYPSKQNKIEDNFYSIDGCDRRFFTINDANQIFSLIGEANIREKTMKRYSKLKKVIEIDATKN